MMSSGYGVPATPVYDMPAPNKALPVRGKLAELREVEGVRTVFTDPDSPLDTWMDPTMIETALETYAPLQQAVCRILQRLQKKGAVPERTLEGMLGPVNDALDAAFSDVLLDELVSRWDRVKPLLARYVLAKEAFRQARGATNG
jgi:hypothetical protein